MTKGGCMRPFRLDLELPLLGREPLLVRCTRKRCAARIAPEREPIPSSMLVKPAESIRRLSGVPQTDHLVLGQRIQRIENQRADCRFSRLLPPGLLEQRSEDR